MLVIARSVTACSSPASLPRPCVSMHISRARRETKDASASDVVIYKSLLIGDAMPPDSKLFYYRLLISSRGSLVPSSLPSSRPVSWFLGTAVFISLTRLLSASKRLYYIDFTISTFIPSAFMMEKNKPALGFMCPFSSLEIYDLVRLVFSASCV